MARMRSRAFALALPLLLAAGAAGSDPGTPEPPRFGAKVDVVLRQARVLVRAPKDQSPWGLPPSAFKVRRSSPGGVLRREITSVCLTRVAGPVQGSSRVQSPSWSPSTT